MIEFFNIIIYSVGMGTCIYYVLKFSLFSFVHLILLIKSKRCKHRRQANRVIEANWYDRYCVDCNKVLYKVNFRK